MMSLQKVVNRFKDHIFGRGKSSINTKPKVDQNIQPVPTIIPPSLLVQTWDEKTRTSVLIDELPLPTQILNTLLRNEIYTIGDLEGSTEEKLIEMKMIGVKSLKKIKDIYSLLFHKTLEFNENRKLIQKPIETDQISNRSLDTQAYEGQHTNPTSVIERTKEYALITPENVFNLKKFNHNTCLKSILRDDIYLDHLDLPQKLLNPLNKLGLYTVGDLRKVPVIELFKIKSLGKIMLVNLSRSLNDENNQKEIIKDGQTFIEALLCRIPEGREKEILIRRYGFITGERQTLEEIGNDYKVTRERIRQLEKKSLIKIKKMNIFLKKKYMPIIETALITNDGIITEEEADKILPLALNINAFDGSSVLNLLVDLGWLNVARIGDVSLYFPLFDKINSDFVLNLTSNIKKLKLIDFTTIEIETLLKEEVINCESNTIKANLFIKKLLTIHPLIQNLNNGRFKLFYSRLGTSIWISMIKKLFEETGTPLHFTEITERINEIIKNNIELHLDVHRTHSLLIESPVFAHTGVRGTYGLVEWGIRKESTFDLCVESINKAGFPLHWKQIFQYVSKYKNTSETNIRSLLTFNKKFSHLGKGVYGLN